VIPRGKPRKYVLRDSVAQPEVTAPKRRYWTPEQLGSRAIVVIRCRASQFNGLEAEGYRVAKPADGWKLRLVRAAGERLEMFGPEMFFGAAVVEVDVPIRPIAEALPPFPARKRDPMCEAAARSAEIKRQTAFRARQSAK